MQARHHCIEDFSKILQNHGITLELLNSKNFPQCKGLEIRMRLFHRVQNPTSNNAKVMIKGLRYCLHALTGNGLEQFIPDSVIPPGTPINVQLKSWSLRPCLKSIHDEESSRFRAMNFLAGPCGLRAYPELEGSHPQWNDYLRAISTLLKATLLVNEPRTIWFRNPSRKAD